MSDDPATTCVICGNYIHAGAFPAVCSEYCKAVLEIECQFTEWVEKGFAMKERDEK